MQNHYQQQQQQEESSSNPWDAFIHGADNEWQGTLIFDENTALPVFLDDKNDLPLFDLHNNSYCDDLVDSSSIAFAATINQMCRDEQQKDHETSQSIPVTQPSLFQWDSDDINSVGLFDDINLPPLSISTTSLASCCWSSDDGDLNTEEGSIGYGAVDPNQISTLNQITLVPSSTHVAARTPSLMLANASVWRQLAPFPNEMIITPAGRRIFPYIKLQAFNLDPNQLYALAMDIVECDPQHIYRYDRKAKLWSPKPLTIPSALPDCHLYWHPALHQSGAFWMSGPIEFADVRVRSHMHDPRRPVSHWTPQLRAPAVTRQSENAGSGRRRRRSYQPQTPNTAVAGPLANFQVQTGHLYVPRFHLIRLRPELADEPLTFDRYSTESALVFTFDCMKFIATTHYQSRQVCSIKAQYNKHVTRNNSNSDGVTEMPIPPSERMIIEERVDDVASASRVVTASTEYIY